jgi:hypothetical protein
MEAKYFVPICLYPHTKYRTAGGITTLFQKYRFDSSEYLIVIADWLLALDNLVTGRYWSYESVFAKARRDAKPVYELIKRVSGKAKAQNRGKIVYWDDIASTGDFKELSRRMRDQFRTEELLSSALEEFISLRVGRFGLGSSPEKEREYEREYLLSEVCMSVFCTEVLGYCEEIWERSPAPNVPDPIKLLYSDRPDAVVRATGRPIRRVLSFLYEMSPAV